MPRSTDQRTQILVVDATQLQTLRAALGDAVEHKDLIRRWMVPGM